MALKLICLIIISITFAYAQRLPEEALRKRGITAQQKRELLNKKRNEVKESSQQIPKEVLEAIKKEEELRNNLNQ